MLPKSLLKQIAQLGQKKFRDQRGLFIVEGRKSVLDFVNQGWKYEGIYTTDSNVTILTDRVSEKEMERMSQMKTPSPMLGVFRKAAPVSIPEKQTIIVLDGIRDPGNLGTIIRQASWFGLQHIVCSKETVDAYNPKVVQASMGGLARVAVHYLDLVSFLTKAACPVYGMSLDGTPLPSIAFRQPAYLVFGSESHGIAPKIEEILTTKVCIPPLHPNAVESLNVASASAIVLAHCLGRF